MLLLSLFGFADLPGKTSDFSGKRLHRAEHRTYAMDVMSRCASQAPSDRSTDNQLLARNMVVWSEMTVHKAKGFFGLPREIRDRIYDWLIVQDEPIIRPISGPKKINNRLLRALRLALSPDPCVTYRKLHAKKLYAEIAGEGVEVPQYLHAYRHASANEPMYVKYINAVCAHALVLNRQFCREVLERVEWWALPALRVLKVKELGAIPIGLVQAAPRRMGVTFAIGCPLVPIAREEVEQTLLSCFYYLDTLLTQLPSVDHLAAAIFIKHNGNHRLPLNLLGPSSTLSAAMPEKGAQLKQLWLGVDCAAVHGTCGLESSCTMRMFWDGVTLSRSSREGDLQAKIIRKTGTARARVVFRVEAGLVDGFFRRMGGMLMRKRR